MAMQLLPYLNYVFAVNIQIKQQLYRNFYQFSNVNPSTLLKLYKSLIRTHMEYACVVWDPHLVKDVKVIEDVQKFALRVCSKSWNSNYESLLSYCRVPTLSNRRKVLKLCLLFNIITGRVVHPNFLKGQLPTIPLDMLMPPSCQYCLQEQTILKTLTFPQPLLYGTL